MSTLHVGIAGVVTSLVVGNAFGATLAGQITDGSGVGIPMEVRLLAEGTKGWYVIDTVTAAADGNYVFSAVDPAGYRVFSRMSGGFGTNYADRWYDQAAPFSSGWIAEDADTVVVPDAAAAITGIDISLPLQGGLDGRITNGAGTPLAGMTVRTEWLSDARYHHQDFSQGDYLAGEFFMRGLVEESYRGIVYDAAGVYATAVFPGPFAVVIDTNAVLSDFVLVPEPADPNEPNDGPSGAGVGSVDDVGLHGTPSLPWSSSGARIGPRGGDIDWHCFDAVAGDHFAISTTTWLDVAGTPRPHPWTDPILSLWTGDGASLITWSDDVDGLNPALDVWIDDDGTYCAVVSTFGDSGWNGTLQTSSGRYELTIAMLNRRPTLLVSEGGTPTPAPPETLFADESSVLVLDLTFGDPDLDPVNVSVVHLDAQGDPVTGGVLDTPVAGTGTFTWDISAVAASGSPYTLEVTVGDGELAVTVVVIIVVIGNNVPPTTPPLITPLPDVVLTANVVDLVVGESIDADFDPVTIEIQARYHDPLGAPDQSASILQTAPPTTFTTAAIPEDTVVYWRARANDGQLENPYSPWTPWQSFLVDVGNDPPPAPEIFKPSESSMVLSRRPTVSVINVVDPDGDTPTYLFQIASDASFATLVTTSPTIPGSPAPTSVWTSDLLLDWDTTYFVRASADDGRGGDSGFGPGVGFRVKPNILPTRPVFVDPDTFDCGTFIYDTAFPTEVSIAEVVDPEGAAITIELGIIPVPDAVDDPGGDDPVTTASTVQDLDLLPTVISFDPAALAEDSAYAYTVLARDDAGETGSTTCGFWIDVDNATPGVTVISEPASGSEVTAEDETVYVTVVPGVDPESAAGVPGTWRTLAYCIGLGATADCDDDPTLWSRLDPSEVEVAGAVIIVEPVAAGEQWTVRTCTLDERGACGPEATATFTVSDPSSGAPPGGCGCAGAPAGGAGLVIAGLMLAMGRRRRRTHG